MRTIFLFILLIPFSLLAQVRDDFSDGDLTTNPAWTGNTDHFKISYSTAVPIEQRPALQLEAPAAGISAIAVEQPFTGSLEWQFWVKLSMNTSSGNFTRVYLMSDVQDLSAPLDGYFLQIGGAEDSVIFYRQDSLEITRLACLNTLYTGNSTNALRFRILRNASGEWMFFADPSGSHTLDLQGESNDFSMPEGDFFGVYCKYTSSNATKFYFDDFYAGPLIIDSVAPVLLKAEAVNPTEIILTFSEAIDPVFAEDTLNYLVSPGPGHPYEAIRLLDASMIQLFFNLPLENGLVYSLEIMNEKDPAGNETGRISVPVWYYLVMPFDLIITEIMADPSPPAGLPEHEYVEIHNRSLFTLDLEGFNLLISSTDHVLPAISMAPGGYLAICDEEAVPVMQFIGPAAGVSSFLLPNSGSNIQLYDPSGNSVFYLDYDDSWYHDDLKSEGGWSMEMIDTGNPCKGEENWAASVSVTGGTPGHANSVPAAGIEPLTITGICCVSGNQVILSFNESLDSLPASDISRYSAEPYPGQPDSAFPSLPDFRSVRLVFHENFVPGIVYTLHVRQGMKNCIGDELSVEISSLFSPAEPAEPFDIVINEILFNPLADGVDYVEILNRSETAVNLENLYLSSVKQTPPNPPDTQSVAISPKCHALLPHEYLALTSDPQKVQDQYFTLDPEAFLKMQSFPSFNNDSGYVLLSDNRKVVIDGIHYSEDMHFIMLNSKEGVALERINPERPGDEPSNWHSAAETCGFGTPGYKNSQYLEIDDQEAAFSLQPEVFSPDGDGKDDQMGIVYNFSSPGRLMTILIFNEDGRPVRTLANNEMPGTSGAYSWDGTLDDRTPACNGIYIFYMEALDMEGRTSRFKRAGVLARTR